MKVRNIGIFLVLLLVAFGTAYAQSRPIVMIDPGHGGDETGVVVEDIQEKDLVLRVGFVLAEELVRRGYDVRMTRTGDYAVAWPDRRAQAEAAGASILIMLHMNGDDDTNNHGTEIYVNLNDAKAAAAAEVMSTSLKKLDQPVVIEGRPWPFLQSPTTTTVMIEAGFLTNPIERRLLTSADFHRELAARIADGVIKAIVGVNRP